MPFNSVKSLWNLWIHSFRHRKDIDGLLANPPSSEQSLKVQIHWLFDLVEWIRRPGTVKTDLDFKSGAPQAARVRYILQILDRNPEWKKNVAKTFRAILGRTRGTELFIQSGLFSQDYFFAELISRVNEKILPQVPEDEELLYIFGENFKSPRDVDWIRLIDPETFKRIVELFSHGLTITEGDWNGLKADCEQAMLLLSLQVQGIGLSADIRKRLPTVTFQQLPFYELPSAVEKFVTEPVRATKKQFAMDLAKKLIQCQRSLKDVHNHLDEQGVSIQIVYKIERLERLLKRINDLLYLLENPEIDPVVLSQFLENLVSENIQRKSIFTLLNQNFSLLSRKIVDRSAETGEHYIARTRSEYMDMLKSALGGGLVTAFTTLVKTAFYAVSLSSFYFGIAASLNYSISFLIIHFCHFTLGTKQPAMTAPAIASKMEGTTQELIDEIVFLIRSQFVAILGNVLGVIPVTLVICLAYNFLTGAPVMDQAHAEHTLHDFNFFGPTPLYAAFTGVLLWSSSLFSGWMDNWFVFHRISAALAHNRRMIFIFGAARSRQIAMFLRKNILGLSANISLGFLLGLTPSVFQFVGIYLEVRHVTLSSGALTAAMVSLKDPGAHLTEFYLAVLGVFSMGIINVGVSFGLALFLAVKAKNTHGPEKRWIYQLVLKRLLQKPSSFFWPTPAGKGPAGV